MKREINLLWEYFLDISPPLLTLHRLTEGTLKSILPVCPSDLSVQIGPKIVFSDF